MTIYTHFKQEGSLYPIKTFSASDVCGSFVLPDTDTFSAPIGEGYLVPGDVPILISDTLQSPVPSARETKAMFTFAR